MSDDIEPFLDEQMGIVGPVVFVSVVMGEGHSRTGWESTVEELNGKRRKKKASRETSAKEDRKMAGRCRRQSSESWIIYLSSSVVRLGAWQGRSCCRPNANRYIYIYIFARRSVIRLPLHIEQAATYFIYS